MPDDSVLKQAVSDAPVLNLTYPYSDKWDYETYLEKIDLDKTRIEDIKTGRGFIIETSRNVKTDIKNQTGIFSSRYGSTVADVDSFNGKYRCRCGLTKGSIMHGEHCPVCNTIVKFYDDDVSIFGWLVLNGQNYVIHPNMYRVLEGFIGESRMAAIIQPIVDVDSDGKIVNIGSTSAKGKKDPFRGIGLLEFKERYDEIIEYYYAKYPAKKLFYEELKARKDIVFTQSIPVFSALLRPSILEGNNTLKYQSVNEYFMMLSKLVQEINRQTLGIDRKVKEKLSLIYDAQMQINAVYDEIKNCLAKKKGDLRGSIGGRYSFTSRSVIRQDPYLRQNHIRLPFAGLMELLQQVIINVLVRTHNISYSQAYKWWFRALVSGYDQTIYDIVDGLIKDQGGIPIIINRNPTINYGSIFKMKCIGINMDYTMSISLLILKPLAADFDGDSLNIMLLTNANFIAICEKVFNPIQFAISKNDGLCNGEVLPTRDILINANSLKSLGRYTATEIDEIEKCMACA